MATSLGVTPANTKVDEIYNQTSWHQSGIALGTEEASRHLSDNGSPPCFLRSLPAVLNLSRRSSSTLYLRGQQRRRARASLHRLTFARRPEANTQFSRAHAAAGIALPGTSLGQDRHWHLACNDRTSLVAPRMHKSS